MYEQVFSRLQSLQKSGRGWHAICPAHHDRTPSLSVAFGDQHQLLLFCHAGCRLEDILKHLGLNVRELFPPGEQYDYVQVHDLALATLRRQRARLEKDREHIEDGECWAIIRHARSLATRLGDSDAAWNLLGQAAALETDMLNAGA